jgi:hypothetical protein
MGDGRNADSSDVLFGSAVLFTEVEGIWDERWTITNLAAKQQTCRQLGLHPVHNRERKFQR